MFALTASASGDSVYGIVRDAGMHGEPHEAGYRRRTGSRRERRDHALGRGVFEVSGNFEYQISSEGHEAALPFAVEYGVTDRLEFLVEPVAYTAIRPKVGAQASGVGEVKFPTARNTLIGTGKTQRRSARFARRRPLLHARPARVHRSQRRQQRGRALPPWTHHAIPLAP